MSGDFTYETKATKEVDNMVYTLGKVFGCDTWLVVLYEDNYRRSKIVGCGSETAMVGLFTLMVGGV